MLSKRLCGSAYVSFLQRLLEYAQVGVETELVHVVD